MSLFRIPKRHPCRKLLRKLAIEREKPRPKASAFLFTRGSAICSLTQRKWRGPDSNQSTKRLYVRGNASHVVQNSVHCPMKSGSNSAGLRQHQMQSLMSSQFLGECLMAERRHPNECEYCGKWKTNPMYRFPFCHRECLERGATDIEFEYPRWMKKKKQKMGTRKANQHHTKLFGQ